MDQERQKQTNENKKSEPKIKEGVDFVFEQSPELVKIGHKEQYSEYLDTIFSGSKIKDIVYHGTDKNFDEFLKDQSGYNLSRGRAFFFTKNKERAKDYSESKKDLGVPFNGEERVISVLLNITNPTTSLIEAGQHVTKEEIEFYEKENIDGLFLEDEESDYVQEYVVFESEQIHILGNKLDIENFKMFIEESNRKSDEKYLV